MVDPTNKELDPKTIALVAKADAAYQQFLQEMEALKRERLGVYEELTKSIDEQQIAQLRDQLAAYGS